MTPELCGEPDISVIIPVFNGKAFLKAAVESVLKQTLKAKELILIDDQSTDGSLQSIDDLSFSCPVVRLKQANAGQSAARNYGASIATGAFLAFLDQDDIWYPEHLENLRKLFLNDTHGRLGFVYSNLDEVDKLGNMLTRNVLDAKQASHPKRSLKIMLGENLHILPSASLIRTSVFKEVGGFDEQFCGYEDDDLFLRIFQAGYSNEYLNEALSQWRLHYGSSASQPSLFESCIRFCRKWSTLYPDEPSMSRFYTRDYIVPRLSKTAISRYDQAINYGDGQRGANILKGALSVFSDETSPDHRYYNNYLILPQLFKHLATRFHDSLKRGESALARTLYWHMASVYNPSLDKSAINNFFAPHFLNYFLSDYRQAMNNRDFEKAMSLVIEISNTFNDCHASLKSALPHIRTSILQKLMAEHKSAISSRDTTAQKSIIAQVQELSKQMPDDWRTKLQIATMPFQHILPDSIKLIPT